MKVLITGGAGFIGTHLARHLLAKGHDVTILDNFLPQVHGSNRSLPEGIAKYVRLVEGDISDRSIISSSLEDIEAVVHLAAETGTGQSMYEVARYTKANVQGTAELCEQLVRSPGKVRRLVCASSRAVYGEGAYVCEADGVVSPASRSLVDKRSGHFDPICPKCGGSCSVIATPETVPVRPSSYYGLTKLTQEQMMLFFGSVLGIPSIALRYQNVYGPGQSLHNPYTGILAIFTGLARTGQAIRVFEDGMESRDFVYVEDVVKATAAALFAPINGPHTLNVGSGQRTTVLDVATLIAEYYGNKSHVQITGEFREGDIRHSLADLKCSQALLGYEPSWDFGRGLEQFLSWAEQSTPSMQGYEVSLKELRDRGFLHA